MSSMFDNYNQLASNYPPNNLDCRPNPCRPQSPIKPVNPNRPYTDYNEKGEIVGYFWNWGDSINLEFEIEGQCTIEDNWISAKDFLAGKYATVKLYNFRQEPIYIYTTERFTGDSDKVLVEINAELSSKLVRGVYYCSLTISDGLDYCQTLIGSGDIPKIQLTVR